MNNETKKCPYCGEEIMADAKKCRHCGEWIESNIKPKESQQINSTIKQHKGYKKLLLMMSIVSLLCIILLIALFSKGSNSTNEAKEEATDSLWASVISSTENGVKFDAASLISLNSINLSEARSRITKSGWELVGNIKVDDEIVSDVYQKNYDDNNSIIINAASGKNPITFETESKKCFDSWGKSLEQLGYVFHGGKDKTIVCESQSSKTLPVIHISRNELLMEVYNANTDKMEYMPMPDGSCNYELSLVQAEETEGSN